MDGYILDFVCFAQKLIIELDGSQHSEEDHRQRDAARDAHFKESGFRVLRFWNNQIDNEFEGVWEVILEALREPD